MQGLTNKFGFDKIILVCDYNNIKKLFCHRYGNSVAFEGYLSKYFSRKPYEYDNNKAIMAITQQLLSYKGNYVESRIGNALQLIINDLNSVGELTLRDLLKLSKHNFHQTIDEQGKLYSERLKVHQNRVLYFNIIAFLEKIFEKEAILEKIKRCKIKVQGRSRINYTYYTTLGFIALMEEKDKSQEYETVYFKNDSLNFKTSDYLDRPLNYEYIEPVQIGSSKQGANFKFNVKDFYEILAFNIEKYIEG